MSDVTQILLEDPDLAEYLQGQRLAAALRELIAPTMTCSAGPWASPEELASDGFGIGLLLLEGLVTRRVGVAGRYGAELLGEGDLLRPWQREDIGTTLPRTGKWRVLRRARMALLDRDFALRLMRYPEVTSTLLARAIRRSRHLAVNMAIVHQPRIDVRLHMLFWELADRWGTVAHDGVHVPLQLTHAMLADLVAARRPTVTKALRDLTARSAVVWTGQDWLLAEEPPAELEAVGEVSIQSSEAALEA